MHASLRSQSGKRLRRNLFRHVFKRRLRQLLSLDSTGEATGGGNATFARLVGSATDHKNAQSGGSSEAWIAGPVVGGVVALILLGIILWWWGQRRRTRWPGQTLSTTKEPEADGQFLNVHNKEADLSEETHNELSGSTKREELGDYSNKAELSGQSRQHSLRHELG
jgi:hypothetical protein